MTSMGSLAFGGARFSVPASKTLRIFLKRDQREQLRPARLCPGRQKEPRHVRAQGDPRSRHDSAPVGATAPPNPALDLRSAYGGAATDPNANRLVCATPAAPAAQRERARAPRRGARLPTGASPALSSDPRSPAQRLLTCAAPGCAPPLPTSLHQSCAPARPDRSRAACDRMGSACPCVPLDRSPRQSRVP